MLQKLISDFDKLSNPEQAKILSSFFKTGKGEYGEGDIFIGIKVPVLRILSKTYNNLSFSDLELLLKSGIHEYRLTALFILILQYENALRYHSRFTSCGGNLTGDQIVSFYLKNKAYINNRDLVDLSAPKILGRYILEGILANNVIPAKCHPRIASCGGDLAGIQSKTTYDNARHRERQRGDPSAILHTLSHSTNLRDRRIAIVSTFTLIKAGFYDDTLMIAETLLHDKHDLIQKAVGRMLREIGKRCKVVEDEFLFKHYKDMPRTMLRYAIEKYPEKERLKWLKGKM